MDKLIKRKELYDLVWSKPITKIAKDYKVSDSAIIKICKKMDIPRPGLGYWTKVECGKKVRKTPLPKLTKKGVDHHYLWRQGYSEGRTDEAGQVHPLIAQESTEEQQIFVPETLDEPHPLTATNIKRFRNAKSDEKGYLRPRAAKHFDLTITQGTVDRTLRIMDALLRAFEARGWEFQIETEPRLGMFVTVLGETIGFSIEEVVHAEEHSITEREQRARKRGEWLWSPRYDFHPSGRLKLQIHSFHYYSGRSSWGDAKIQRVENCLNKFCAGLVQYAEATKQKRYNDELKRRRRKRESDARGRYQARQDNFQALSEQLLLELKSWRFAEDVREYVAESQKLVTPESGLGESHDRWRGWALAFADAVDPLMGGKPVDPAEIARPKTRYY